MIRNIIEDYEKQTVDSPNPISRFAHRKRFKISKQTVFNWVQENSVLLDFGCGHGRFLHELSQEDLIKNKSCKLLGYDPYLPANYESFTVVSDQLLIPDSTIDIITCLEVIEHLSDADFDFFLAFANKKLKKNGKILVTVPIMIGPAVFAKELTRRILYRKHIDTTLVEVLKSGFFAIPPPRTTDLQFSHKGFDWRAAKKKLVQVFSLTKLSFSPVPLIGWYGNSQAIMELQKVG